MKIAEFLRQLRASDCFLANVKRLPSFPTIEQQFDKLMIFLEAAKFNEEQCTKAAEQVQKLSMFSSQNVERLLQKVAEACANGAMGAMEVLPQRPRTTAPFSGLCQTVFGSA